MVAEPISEIDSAEVLEARIAWPGVQLVELGEHGLLDLHLLGDRLDDEVDLAEALVLGGAGDQPEDLLQAGVRLLLGDLLLPHQAGELTLGHLARLLQPGVDELLLDVLDHHRDVGRGDHLSDLASHRPGAEHRSLEYEHEAAKPIGTEVRRLTYLGGRPAPRPRA